MAGATYTTDLTLIHACDAASASWTEPTGFTVGSITLPETDYFIHNTGCLSKNQQATGGNGAIFNVGSGVTIPTNGAFFAWVIFSAPNALGAEAAGGVQMFVGSATSAFKQFYVRGNDTYTYGGWVCVPVNPLIDSQNQTIAVNSTNKTFTRSSGSFVTDGFEANMPIVTTGFTNAGNNTSKVIESVTTLVITVTSATGLVTETPGGGDERIRFCDALTGAPSTTMQYFGAGVNCPSFAPTKGNAFGLDIVRYGRGEARMVGGDLANGYATFAGFATQNDALANRWGILQAVGGGYQVQGLIVLGYGGAVDFRDSNKSIVFVDTKRVTSNFNGIEVRNSSSRVDMTAVSFQALGTTSKGKWIATDDVDVNLDGCTFTDLGTLDFKSQSTILNTTFRRCGRVTQVSPVFAGGATFTGCTFDKTADATAAFSMCRATMVTYCTFQSSGTKHAIELTAAIGSEFNLYNNTFMGYATSNGSTGNEVILNATGTTITLNISGNIGTISIKNVGAGSVTNLVSGSAACTVTVKNASTDVVLPLARVLILAATGGPLPFQAPVTITRVTTVATVAHTAHGLSTGNKVLIAGANQPEYNGVKTIAYIGVDSYSYTVSGTPDSPATGTIKATYVIIDDETDSNGLVTYTRSYSSNQPITGRVRRYTSGAYFKTSTISNIINSTNGISIVVQLIPET